MSLQCPGAMHCTVTMACEITAASVVWEDGKQGALYYLRKVSTALAKSVLRSFFLWLDVGGVPGFLRDTLMRFLPLHR